MKFVIISMLLSLLLSAGCGDGSGTEVMEVADPEITHEQQDAMYDGDE